MCPASTILQVVAASVLCTTAFNHVEIDASGLPSVSRLRVQVCAARIPADGTGTGPGGIDLGPGYSMSCQAVSRRPLT